MTSKTDYIGTLRTAVQRMLRSAGAKGLTRTQMSGLLTEYSRGVKGAWAKSDTCAQFIAEGWLEEKSRNGNTVTYVLADCTVSPVASSRLLGHAFVPLKNAFPGPKILHQHRN